MRLSWRVLLIGFVLALIVGYLLVDKVWLYEFIDAHWRIYWRQFLRMWPISLGAIVGSLILLLIEVWILGWQNSSLAALMNPSKSAANDIFLWLFSLTQISFIIVYLITFNVFIEIRPVVREFLGLDRAFIPQIQNTALQLIVYILLIDFMGYVHHYTMHFISPLWAFHKVHHSATEFNVITAERGHPVDTNLVADVVFTIPLAIMGFPLMDVTFYVIIRHFMAMMHHARFAWDWGWIGKYVLVSPQYHRIHHSNLPEHSNKNLSIIFPIWDHLFRTYNGDRIELHQIGTADNNYNKISIIHDFFVSFQDSWKEIVAQYKVLFLKSKDGT